jgi:tetratricopeptide (TPR) repeat protein
MVEATVVLIPLLLMIAAFLTAPSWIAHRKGYRWAPWMLTGIPGLLAVCLLWRANGDAVSPAVRTRRCWRGNALGIALTTLTLITVAWRIFEVGAQTQMQEAGSTWQLLDDDAKRLLQQGDYANATTVSQDALRLAERTYGSDSLPVAVSLNNLAAIYQRQQRYASAEPLLKRAVGIYLQSPSASDTDLAANYCNLAINYVEMKQDDNATLYYWKCLGILEKPGKKFDPAICRIMIALSQVSRRSGKYAEAESFLNRSCTSGQRLLGHDHVDVINSFINLGALYLDQRRYSDAESVFVRVVAVIEQKYGTHSQALIDPLAGLVTAYKATDRPEFARQTEQRLKAIPQVLK